MESFRWNAEVSTAAPGVDLKNRFSPLDGIVFGYTAIIAIFTFIFHAKMPAPVSILALHVFVLAAIVLLPPRGSRWETVPLAGFKAMCAAGSASCVIAIRCCSSCSISRKWPRP